MINYFSNYLLAFTLILENYSNLLEPQICLQLLFVAPRKLWMQSLVWWLWDHCQNFTSRCSQNFLPSYSPPFCLFYYCSKNGEFHDASSSFVTWPQRKSHCSRDGRSSCWRGASITSSYVGKIATDIHWQTNDWRNSEVVERKRASEECLSSTYSPVAVCWSHLSKAELGKWEADDGASHPPWGYYFQTYL
jgi:hypothetical protein